jgi:ribosome-associated translation inhibitor RaiA
MNFTTDLAFHQIDRSPSVEAAIERWLGRLESVHSRIQRISVHVSQPHKSHRQGREFQVSVMVEIPGRTIPVTQSHEDIYLAVSDAFRTARRMLLDVEGARRELRSTRPPLTPAWR